MRVPQWFTVCAGYPLGGALPYGSFPLAAISSVCGVRPANCGLALGTPPHARHQWGARVGDHCLIDGGKARRAPHMRSPPPKPRRPDANTQ